MAKRTVVEFDDDLSGGPAAQTVRFAIDGAGYEIDLTDDNAATLRRFLAPYVAAARRARAGAPSTPTRRHRGAPDHDPKTVRAWARSRGIAVSDRGRIPAGVLAQFRAAGG